MSTTTSPAVRLCLLAGLVLTIAICAFAQSQATTGNIEGTVVDPNGAVVPNVTITHAMNVTQFRKDRADKRRRHLCPAVITAGTIRLTTCCGPIGLLKQFTKL